MPTPSPQIIQLLSTFAVAMTAPTFAKSLTLLYGAILAPGARTVSAALRVMRLGKLETFVNYHRVLNRNRWSPWVLSELWLRLIISLLVPEGAVLLLMSALSQPSEPSKSSVGSSRAETLKSCLLRCARISVSKLSGSGQRERLSARRPAYLICSVW